MLMLFRETVIVSGHSADPLRETIRIGLGRRPAAMVPLMFSMVAVVAWSLLHPSRTPDVVPDMPELALIPAGAIIAFWAFVGFASGPRAIFPVAVFLVAGAVTLARARSRA